MRSANASRGQRVVEVGLPVGVGGGRGHEIGVLAPQSLVGLAGFVPLLDALGHPFVATGLGPLLHRGRPLLGETVVVDPARIQRRPVGVVDDRERSDGRQPRGLGLGGEELRDAGIGQPHHPHLTVGHPALSGHGLDDVVHVGHLGGLEEAEVAARAGGPEVHAHGGVAHGVGDRRAGLGGVRVGQAVGDLDHGGGRGRRPAFPAVACRGSAPSLTGASRRSLEILESPPSSWDSKSSGSGASFSPRISKGSLAATSSPFSATTR